MQVSLRCLVKREVLRQFDPSRFDSENRPVSNVTYVRIVFGKLYFVTSSVILHVSGLSWLV